jgi:hypothetical protein
MQKPAGVLHHILENLQKLGAQVFVFFEANDINKPVYFAAAQSGPGWFAEHPNQHVFQSDNIRIRIDEQPSHPDSTCKFNSYNEENCVFSKDDGTKTDMQTRLDIEVLAKDINAVNIQIHGDVNMKILGDWYVHHEGDKHETQNPIHTYRITGRYCNYCHPCSHAFTCIEQSQSHQSGFHLQKQPEDGSTCNSFIC